MGWALTNQNTDLTNQNTGPANQNTSPANQIKQCSQVHNSQTSAPPVCIASYWAGMMVFCPSEQFLVFKGWSQTSQQSNSCEMGRESLTHPFARRNQGSEMFSDPTRATLPGVTALEGEPPSPNSWSRVFGCVLRGF